MRRVSSGTTRVGNASPRPQVSDARRVLRRFPPACCRTSDETPRDSATEESEVRRMDEEPTERASNRANQCGPERARSIRSRLSETAFAVERQGASVRANRRGTRRICSDRTARRRSASSWSTGERGALPTNRIRSEGLRRSSDAGTTSGPAFVRPGGSSAFSRLGESGWRSREFSVRPNVVGT